MHTTNNLFEHRFLAIEHPDGYYHAADEYEPHEPIESKNIHRAIHFHEHNKNEAEKVLTALQHIYKEIPEYINSKIHSYQYLLLNEGTNFDEKNCDVIQRHWVLTKSWIGDREYLTEGNRSHRNIEYAMQLTLEEAKLIAKSEKNSWIPAEFIIIKKHEEEKTEKIVLLSEEKEYVIGFDDGFYVAGSPYGNLKSETRYFSESTRFHKSGLDNALKKIKEEAENHFARMNPVTYEINLIPSFEIGIEEVKEGYQEVERYYAVSLDGSRGIKIYDDLHFNPKRYDDEDELEEAEEEYVWANTGIIHYYHKDEFDYFASIPRKHLSWNEAKDLAEQLDEDHQEVPKHKIVEIVVLSKKV